MSDKYVIGQIQHNMSDKYEEKEANYGENERNNEYTNGNGAAKAGDVELTIANKKAEHAKESPLSNYVRNKN